jgi:hypothetical protein
MLAVASSFIAALAPAGLAQSLDTRGVPAPAAAVLLDSAGKVAAKPFSDAIVLVFDRGSGIVAPALIRPVYGDDGRAASGWATWHSGGSVLYTSPDCTTGAHVYSTGHAALRATAQVRTPDGIVLYVGVVGTTTTVGVRSILYETGCAAVTVEQNGLLPVVLSINLTTTYPPPLSYQ